MERLIRKTTSWRVIKKVTAIAPIQEETAVHNWLATGGTEGTAEDRCIPRVFEEARAGRIDEVNLSTPHTPENGQEYRNSPQYVVAAFLMQMKVRRREIAQTQAPFLLGCWAEAQDNDSEQGDVDYDA
jgi:hypothetical protein